MDVTGPLDFRKCHENCGSAFPSPSQTIQPLERAVEFRSALGEYTKTRILGGYPHLWMQPNHKSGLMVCKSLKRLQPPINTKTTLDVSNKSVGRFEILLGDFNPCWKYYWSQIGTLPQVGMKVTNIWNHRSCRSHRVGAVWKPPRRGWKVWNLSLTFETETLWKVIQQSLARHAFLQYKQQGQWSVTEETSSWSRWSIRDLRATALWSHVPE